MAYEPYVSVSEYAQLGYNAIPDQELQQKLKEASRNIDLLTFNRIVGYGFDNLSEFQKEVIKECTCKLANFYYENEDLIKNVLQSYSINGVSMNFGQTWNVYTSNGVAVSKSTYALLKTTGLCNVTIGW